MIRKQSAEEQIATMQHLINFGVNESSSKTSKPIVEFKRKAANGKTYGIIRESTKYYIMEAPQKDTEILAEDFDYIGGYNNRKENEYTSYSKASNALDLKIMSINESVGKKDRVVIEAPTIKADWEDNLTESMRKEIDRFKSITDNVAKILKEDKSWGEIPSEHTLPEAPAKNPSEKEVNAPFTQSGVAKGEKDFDKEQHNHETAGTPYDKDGKSSVEKNMQSDKKPVINTDSKDLTSEETYEPDNNIASKNPSGGKVFHVNENKGKKIRLKLTEEQVLAWNDNKDFMDTKQGTHVGSSDPFTNELGKESNQTEADTDPIIKEGNGDSVVYDHPTDQGSPTPGTTDVETEDGDPFDKNVNEDVEADDAAGFDDVPFPEVEDDDYGTKFDNEYADFEASQEGLEDGPEYEIDMDDVDDSEAYNDHNLDGLDLDNWNVIDDEDDLYENKNKSKRRLSEDKLDVWGKHPAWRKQPMTTPPNKEVAINGAREWDDESAQGEEPYAKQIGDGSPFNDIVNEVTNSILKKIYGNKKKV
jgi:hypothetical protein